MTNSLPENPTAEELRSFYLREGRGEEQRLQAGAADEKQRLERALFEERIMQESSARDWVDERERILDEIEQVRAAAAAAERRSPAALLDATAAVLPVSFSRQPPVVAPFSREACGVNLVLSEDGYEATRTRGCRQSVAVGSSPLQRTAHGWFFEVVIGETVTGWVGGLGIGVTSTPPAELRRVPDKAWRLPSTYIVGYWGCVFLDGTERRTEWRSDTLQAGSRVGLLVTADAGDLIVFVDDVPAVFAPGALRSGDSERREIEPLYPVVDVFAATRMVTLSERPSPPEPPWNVDEHLLPTDVAAVRDSPRSTRAVNNGNADLMDTHALTDWSQHGRNLAYEAGVAGIASRLSSGDSTRVPESEGRSATVVTSGYR